MANPIIQAIYDLKDNISARIKVINDALRGNQRESERTAAATEKSGKRQSEAYKSQADAIGLLRDNLGKIAAAAAAAGAALKLIDFSRAGFDEAGKVEDSIARIGAIAKTTADDFEQLGDAIEEAAIAANVSTDQAALAAAALAEQGQSAKEIFETLTPTLLLAKDAQIEVSEAAGIVDDALDLFGKSAGDAALVVDQLVAASKGSKEGLAGLATAVRTLAPDAQALGLTFEQLTGMLSLLGQNGIDAGKAARGLRTVFQDLQDPTSKFSLALGDLGDSSGDFGKAIETLRSSGDRGKQALLGLDGAARSLLLFLIQQAPGSIKGFVDALKEAQGTASETAKTIDSTLRGSFTAFSNAFDRLSSAIAKQALTPLAEEFQKLADQLTEFSTSDSFARLTTAFQELFTNAVKQFDEFISHVDWSKFVDGATHAVSDVAGSLNELSGSFRDVANTVNEVGGFFSNLHTLDQEAGKALDGATKAVGNFALALGALGQGDLPAAARAMDDVGAAVNKAAEHYDKFSEALNGGQQALSGVEPSANRAAEAVEGVGTKAETAIEGLQKIEEVGPGVFENTRKAAVEAALAEASVAAASKAHAEEVIKARKAVEDAHTALLNLVKSGTASAEAMQQASQKYEAAKKNLESLTTVTKSADEAQRGLEQAFKNLGLTTQKQLDKAADDAKRDLDTIRQAFLSGNATLEDVKRAYDAYAAKVRASVADSSDAVKAQKESQLQVLASTLGLTDALGKAGEAGKKAGEDTAEAFGKAGDKVGDTAQAAKDASDAFHDQSQGWADQLAATATAAASAAQGIVLLTADQLRGLREIRDELVAGGLTLQQYEERIQEVMFGTSEAIQRQIDQLARLRATEQDLLDQIAQESGDDVASEDARHRKALEDIKEEATLDGALNVQQYNRLKALEDKLHELKLKHIEEQQRAQDTSSQGGGGSSAATSASTPSGTTVQRGTSIPGLTIDFSGATIIGGTKEQIGEQIARLVVKPLERIALRSR